MRGRLDVLRAREPVCARRTKLPARVAAVGAPLSRLLGVEGGRGNLDGVGSEARFTQPMSITGDSRLRLRNRRAGLRESLGVPARQPGPRGVRRISRSTGEVTWIESDRRLSHLVVDGGSLYAGGGVGRNRVSVHKGFYIVQPPLREVVVVDKSNGALRSVAGADTEEPPRDGVAGEARFASIRGMAADGAGGLYVTDSTSSADASRRRADADGVTADRLGDR